MEITDHENEQHTLKRETTNLATQVESTQFSNANLLVLVPTSVVSNIEEEAATKFPPPTPSEPPKPTTTTRTRPTYQDDAHTSEPAPQKTQPEVHETPKEEPLSQHQVAARKTPDLDIDQLGEDLGTVGDENLEELVRSTEPLSEIDPYHIPEEI